MAMKSSVIREMMLYSVVKVSQCLRRTHCLQLQGRRVSQARNHHQAGSEQSCSPCWFHHTIQHYMPEDRSLQKIITFSGIMLSKNAFTTFHHANATD
jgi:hypothetical protein